MAGDELDADERTQLLERRRGENGPVSGNDNVGKRIKSAVLGDGLTAGKGGHSSEVRRHGGGLGNNSFELRNNDFGGWHTRRSWLQRILEDENLVQQVVMVLWIALFAATAAALNWWVPQWFWRGINVSALVCNMAGAAVVAGATTFEQDPFETVQTYAVCKGIKFGFCAVLTNFSILIEDSERLLHTDNWWLSPVNLLLNVGLAIGAYQASRIASLRVKAGAQFSLALLQMENEDRRMKVELEAQRVSDAVDSGVEGASTRGMGQEEGGKWETQLISHMQERLERQRQQRHRGRGGGFGGLVPLPPRHTILALTLVVLPIINSFLLTHRFDNSTQIELANEQYDYSLSVLLSVVGALAAKYYGTQKVKRTDVQWRTFRVNMASCILIATAHNVLFFRNYFPSLSHESFTLFLKRFVQCFCGSLSSFAELVDETVVLINSKSCPREVVARNIFYNLLLCLAVFFFIVYLASGLVSLIWSIPL